MSHQLLTPTTVKPIYSISISISSSLPNVEEMPDMHISLSNVSISVEEVHEALVSLDVQKSPGIDQISPRILQNCVDPLCGPLHHLFTQSLFQAYLPSCWKVHKVVPVLKLVMLAV